MKSLTMRMAALLVLLPGAAHAHTVAGMVGIHPPHLQKMLGDGAVASTVWASQHPLLLTLALSCIGASLVFGMRRERAVPAAA